MSTADNATIKLAAEIGKRRPTLDAILIGKIAGKMVKLCASLRKAPPGERDHEWMIEKCSALAHEVDGRFEVLHNIQPYDSPNWSVVETFCYLHLGSDTIKVTS